MAVLPINTDGSLHAAVATLAAADPQAAHQENDTIVTPPSSAGRVAGQSRRLEPAVLANVVGFI